MLHFYFSISEWSLKRQNCRLLFENKTESSTSARPVGNPLPSSISNRWSRERSPTNYKASDGMGVFRGFSVWSLAVGFTLTTTGIRLHYNVLKVYKKLSVASYNGREMRLQMSEMSSFTSSQRKGSGKLSFSCDSIFHFNQTLILSRVSGFLSKLHVNVFQCEGIKAVNQRKWTFPEETPDKTKLICGL